MKAGMKYLELVDGIKRFEYSLWFGEYVYFKALEMLKEVRANLDVLDAEKHVKQIIKMFLIQWGGMRRTIDRDGLSWEQLTEQLRNSKEVFQKLRDKSLLDMNLNNKELADAIVEAYNSARVRYVGATAVSKILHLLNPELFIMWDYVIREKYEVTGSARGYLKFLKRVKGEIEEALTEEAAKKGCGTDEVARTICTELPSSKLGPEYSRKTLAKLLDEYNWWNAHYSGES